MDKVTVIPSIRQVYYSTYATLPTTGLTAGDFGYATDRLTLYRWSGSAWQAISNYSGSDVYANIPTAANLPNGSIFYATDRQVAYQVQAGAWQPITIYSGSGTNAAKPSAALFPNGSLYYETDTVSLWQVQSSAWVVISQVGITVLKAVKTADQAITSQTTPQNDNALTVNLLANTKYVVKVLMPATGCDTVNYGFNSCFSAPAGCTGFRMTRVTQGGVSAANVDVWATDTDLTTARTGTANAEIPTWLEIDAIVLNGANAGALLLKWAQRTSSVNTITGKAGGYMTAMVIG